MEIEKKGKHLNTLKKYHIYIYIYKVSRNRVQMNDTHIDLRSMHPVVLDCPYCIYKVIQI
jgi:hypothetical protein